MFDSFIVKCPKCNHDLEFQSKSGPCALYVYRDFCPPDIAIGIDGDIVECQFCERRYKLDFSIPKTLTPKITSTKKEADYSGNYNPDLPKNKKRIKELIKIIHGKNKK
jgi:uncharacterized protein YbaR (Trm112 family)